MTPTATGRFDVSTTPEPDGPGGVGRLSIEKVFHGDLDGRSVGTMLAVRTATPGSAGYVLIEQVAGTIDGRSGGFSLQHFGLMTRGRPELRVSVIPDSGTGDLVGLAGEMAIDPADHTYILRYALEPPG